MSEPTTEPRATKGAAFKRHGKQGALVALIAAAPAILGAWTSYTKVKGEADAGYKALVAEVDRQGKAMEAMQKDEAEWRRTVLLALLHNGSTGAPSSSPPRAGGGARTPAQSPTARAAAAPPPREELRKLAERPAANMPFHQKALPRSLDMAQQQMQRSAENLEAAVPTAEVK